MMTMNKSVQKAISVILAYVLTLPMLFSLTVFADDADGLVPDQTQPLTVVGKRVTGDDVYFEISLEVNEDEDNFSSVGVVLQYDPDYIIPAASWDKEALPADMTENTTWATRRALPTLGLETWSTQTALAYETTDENDKKVGYLYLGAEHPLPGEKAPEASDTPSEDESGSEAVPADAGDAPANPDETEEPIPTPQPGAHPIVAVRFMYKTTAADEDAGIAEVKGKDMKEKLVTDWRDGANSAGVIPAKNWDYDWSANKILTIASDEIAAKSPAQYPFAIYTHAYEEKAYMHTFPAPWTPAPSPAASPAAAVTPKPASAYKPVVGAGIAEANKLKAKDITVITLEGDSAKSGGLKLSDIYVILFFDWDDSLLGTLTTGVGLDATEDVNNYVEEKFIYPDLRRENVEYAIDDGTGEFTVMPDWKKREFSYRGEYPYDGPRTDGEDVRIPGGANSIPEEIDDGSGNMITNPDAGSFYPLSNKLDYTFAGKNIRPEYPFANGWVQVLPKKVNYKEEDYPGHLLKIQPKAMSEVWSTVDTNSFVQTDIDETFGVCPELDSNGELVNPDDTIPSLISFDFSQVKQSDLANSDGNLYVKAAYEACDTLNYDYNNNYTKVGEMETSALSSNFVNIILSSIVKFRRLNPAGYGVTRLRKPGVDMEIKQQGASQYVSVGYFPESTEVFEVEMMPTNFVEAMRYKLVEAYQANVIAGGERVSFPDEDVLVAGAENLWWHTVADDMLKDAYEDWANNWTQTGEFDGSWADPEFMEAYMKLYMDPWGTPAAYDPWTFANSLMMLFDEMEASGEPWSPTDLTWFQVQYAEFEGTCLFYGFYYLPPEDAKLQLMQFNMEWGGILHSDIIPELFTDYEELGFF